MPDLQTWMQCFSVYVSVLAIKFPQHIPELLADSRDIMRASWQFKWPSWVIYNTNYRRHITETGQHNWSKVDPSIYARWLVSRIAIGYPRMSQVAVNDGISKELCSLSYVSVDTIAKEISRLGRGAMMAKMDVRSAYWLIPVHRCDRPLCWNDHLFIDKALPFGLWSARIVFTNGRCPWVGAEE